LAPGDNATGVEREPCASTRVSATSVNPPPASRRSRPKVGEACAVGLSCTTARSQSEVAAGGGGEGFEGSDIAVDQDREVAVPGLSGDPSERDSAKCGGGDVAGA
jgi:hypothetical protein